MAFKNILESNATDPPRVKSSVSFVDRLTGGGFVVPGSYLITGDSNAGKTTLMAQVANGITASGNICLFNSLEMIESHFLMLLKRLRLMHGFMVSFEKDPAQLMLDWRNLCRENKEKGKHVVLIQDSLQALARGDTALNTLVQFQERANSWQSTVIFIGQATKSGKYRGSSTLQHEVTAHIHLSVLDNDKQQVRQIETAKNRAGACETIYTELGEKGHEEVAVDDFGGVF